MKFIQNTVNPIGYEVDELGKFGDEGDFEDGYEQNIEYVIDSDDYRLFWYHWTMKKSECRNFSNSKQKPCRVEKRKEKDQGRA